MNAEAAIQSSAVPTGRIVLIQITAIVLLALLLLWPELQPLLNYARKDTQATHVLVAPLLGLLVLFTRRRELAASPGRGSPVGLVFICIGLLLFFASLWPFNHALPRYYAALWMVAGGILSAAGWRTLRCCLPAVLLLLIAIPLGPRLFETLMRIPERYTLDVVTAIVEMMPGVMGTSMIGPDMEFVTSDGRGTIALGEPHRWTALVFANLLVVGFVSLVRVRPFWQLAVMAVLAAPIVLICNLARILTWVVLTIYGGAEPTSGAPRMLGAVVCLGLAYVLTHLTFWTLDQILTETPEEESADA